MTVTYTKEVSTSSFACFLKLLLRWRGSVYKLLWKEFLLFAGLYFALSALYRFVLNPDQKKIFEAIAWYCETYNNLIPVAFVLGFYVSLVVGRWWDQFSSLPWPDTLALKVTAHLQGQDERARLMRRTIMRYMCLALVITLHSISPVIKKRFPTFRHMTEAGFMNEGEQQIIEKIPTSYNKYWVPLVWSTSLVTRARKENKIKDDFAVKTLIDEINEVRMKMGRLFNYDWVTVPLVYTQVVTLAVHMFLISCLMGRQFVEGEHARTGDMYFPFFTFLQFFFYLGWLKVAETMVNPFGEDDDDFNTNYLIDRDLQVAYLIVDEMHQEHPDLIRDQYWDNVTFDLPYTEASQHLRVKDPLLGSAMNLNVEPEKAEFVRLEAVKEEDDVSEVISNNGADAYAGSRQQAAAQKRDALIPRLLRGLSRQGSDRSTRSIARQSYRASYREEDADDTPRVSESEIRNVVQEDHLTHFVPRVAGTEERGSEQKETSPPSDTNHNTDAKKTVNKRPDDVPLVPLVTISETDDDEDDVDRPLFT